MPAAPQASRPKRRTRSLRASWFPPSLTAFPVFALAGVWHRQAIPARRPYAPIAGARHAHGLVFSVGANLAIVGVTFRRGSATGPDNAMESLNSYPSRN